MKIKSTALMLTLQITFGLLSGCGSPIIEPVWPPAQVKVPTEYSVVHFEHDKAVYKDRIGNLQNLSVSVPQPDFRLYSGLTLDLNKREGLYTSESKLPSGSTDSSCIKPFSISEEQIIEIKSLIANLKVFEWLNLCNDAFGPYEAEAMCAPSDYNFNGSLKMNLDDFEAYFYGDAFAYNVTDGQNELYAWIKNNIEIDQNDCPESLDHFLN